MKQDLLETLIKQVLFEQRTVAKIRNASAKMTAEARLAGAVHAYAVLVKGTSNPRDIQDLVEAATNASVGGDTETVAVGKNSKFGNGNYMYVCSTPKSDKRQLINVWIAPTSVIQSLPDHERPIEGEEQAKQGFTKIGNSIMLTKSQLSIIKNIDATEFDLLIGETTGLAIPVDDKDVVKEPDVKKDDVKKDDNTEWLNKNVTKNVTFPYTWHTYTDRNKPIQLTVYKAKILDDTEYLYTKLIDNAEWLVMYQPERFIPAIEKQQADPDTTIWNELWKTINATPEDQIKLDALQNNSSTSTNSTDTNDSESYKPVTRNGIEYPLKVGKYEFFLVEKKSLNSDDSYIAFLNTYYKFNPQTKETTDGDPRWQIISSNYIEEFERLYKQHGADLVTLPVLKQVLGISSVANTYISKQLDKLTNKSITQDNTESKPKPPVKPEQPVKTDPNKTKVIKLNTEKTESRNGIVFINLSKTPVYNYKNKKWVKVGDYDPKDGQYIAYLGNSSDYKYVRVKFAKDQVTAWVPTSAVK